MLLNCLNCIKIALQISSHIQVKLQSRIKCKALCAHSLNTTMHGQAYGQAYGHITVYIYFNDPHGAIRAQSPRLASNSIGNFQLSNCPELCR